MTLSEWLDMKKWTNRDLAEAVGVTPEAARLYRAALRRPQPDVRKKITKVTKGLVTENDMLTAYEQQKQKAR